MKFNKSLQSEIDLLDEEVQEMVEMLSSDDEGDRLVAAVNLQQECDEDTIPFLIHALEDSSSSVQLIAVTTLWEIAYCQIASCGVMLGLQPMSLPCVLR